MTKPMALSATTAQPVPSVARKRYVFLLMNAFSQLSFTCALEALRMANGFEDKRWFDWLVLSENGAPVTASNGLAMMVDGGFQELSRHDTLIVVGGDDIAANSTLGIMNWLRRQARLGVCVGALAADHTRSPMPVCWLASQRRRIGSITRLSLRSFRGWTCGMRFLPSTVTGQPVPVGRRRWT